MKVAVMGSGGVGGYFGGLLARKGHDVTFVARGAHLEAIRENGFLAVESSLDGTISRRPETHWKIPEGLASRTCSYSR
jgi:2-dehydropantoate 2-reductase